MGKVLPAISAGAGRFMGGTAKTVGKLYKAVTGKQLGPSRSIEYASAALIVIALVVIVGAVAAVRAMRHRRLTPASSSAAR